MPNAIVVLNGPNLNLLGSREPHIYGTATLKDVEDLCRKTATEHGFDIAFHQSNSEGELVDLIQAAGRDKAAGLLINAGAYSHTSIAIHDALAAISVPIVEVHISNIFAREPFRHHSHISSVAFAVLTGFGIDGYRLAISGLAARLKAASKAG